MSPIPARKTIERMTLAPGGQFGPASDARADSGGIGYFDDQDANPPTYAINAQVSPNGVDWYASGLFQFVDPQAVLLDPFTAPFFRFGTGHNTEVVIEHHHGHTHGAAMTVDPTGPLVFGI